VGTRLLMSMSMSVTAALGAFAVSAGVATFVLYAFQVLHLGPFGYGVMLTVMAAGWVVSSFFVHRVVDRLGYAWSMRLSQIGLVACFALVAFLPPWPLAIGFVLFAMSTTVMVWNVCSQSSRQRFTPTALLGWALTGHRALAWGLNPLGALVGGLVAAGAGLRAVWVVGAAVQAGALAVAWWGLSPGAFAVAERALDDDLAPHGAG